MENKKIMIEAIIAIGAIAVIVGAFFFAHNFGYSAYANEPYGTDPEKKMELVIESGESVMDVAEELEANKMITSKFVFWFRSKFSEYNGFMKAGTYQINETMGNDDILAVITQSETTNE